MIRATTAGQIGIVTLVLLVPIVVPSVVAPTPTAGWVGNGPPSTVFFGPQSTHIEHVITVVMENRDYDNYFGEYCLALGKYCSSVGNGIPSGTCVPNVPGNPYSACTVPFNMTAAQMNTTPDLNHDWISGRIAWNNGGMNGFYSAEDRGSVPFGHYNGSTIPIYWDMAEEYSLGDNMFAANLSYSLPNHWYLIAGQAPNITQISKLHDTTDRATYISEANNTSTVEDLLNATSVSWNYYDYNLSSYPAALNTVHYTGPDSAYDYWNPMASRAESYTPAFSSHFVPRASLLTDLKNGTLPDVSWVIPLANASDHPDYNETPGQEWVAQLVDAVETSQYWKSTAIFVVWDDYGGWYDHVPPPRVMTKLLSFRSPFLVISPYAKENYISHEFVDFFSLLHYIEWQFNLGCLTPLDCTAPLPFDFFDFNQTARSPIVFPTSWLNATYPMPLQTEAPMLCSGCYTIDPSLWEEGGPPTGNLSLDT